MPPPSASHRRSSTTRAPDHREALVPVRALVPPQVPDALLQRGLMTWAALFGTVSFELFGQVDHVVSEESGDRDAFFAECVQRWATQVGIASNKTVVVLGPYSPTVPQIRGCDPRPPRAKTPGQPLNSAISCAHRLRNSGVPGTRNHQPRGDEF